MAGTVAGFVKILALSKHLGHACTMSTTAPAFAATPLLRALSRELARAGGLLSPDYLESGLSLGEARCVYELGQENGLALTALAERLELDLGYVSRVVSRLAGRGLATKRAGLSDGRSRTVQLTRKGRAQLARLDRQANERFDALVARKPASAVESLVVGLQGWMLTQASVDVVLRNPRPGEIGRIITRHAELYAALGYPPEFERYVVDAFGDFVRDFAPPRDQIVVADRAGRMLGSIAVKGLAHATAQLRFLFVEPDARRLGLGHRLVRHVIEHARANAERRIVLDTASDLAAARALYREHGFRRTATAAAAFLPRGVRSERWALELR